MSAPPTPPTILRVGLTGNIGAGKSTVGAMLAASDCLVIDADELGRELLRPGAAAYAEAVAAFGNRILSGTGEIDRAALGSIIFADDSARERLNAIMHPRIRQLERSSIDGWPAQRGIAITEAALLVETGAAGRYARLVVVDAPREVRFDRLRERGMGATDIERRMAAQMPAAEKAACADYLINNGGTLATTRAAVDAVRVRLEEDLAAFAAGITLPARTRQQ